MHGATALELSTVIIGKIAHFGLLLAPLANHATSTVLAAVASFIVVQGMVLACTFAVSHNVAGSLKFRKIPAGKLGKEIGASSN